MSTDKETEDALHAFEQNLRRNLEKNGFPEKSVAFPIDSLFEAASAKGFSFNKIRERLEAQDVAVELEEKRVVFSAKPVEPQPTASAEDSQEMPGAGLFGDLGTMASEVLNKISPEQMKQMRDMVGNIDATQLAELKNRLASMSEEEKQSMLQQMKGFLGKN